MNYHRVSRISLSPEVVDGIVFWTKNPIPMLNRLGELSGYAYCFQFTVTPYERDIEQNLPDKQVVIQAFRQLSAKIGPKRVIWRYDPILLTGKYDIGYHTKSFGSIAERLSGYTEKCIISFVDLYKKTQRNTQGIGLTDLGPREMYEIAGCLAETAARHNITIETCSETMDLHSYGIEHGSCIDPRLFEELSGCRLNLKKDKNQRPECGCASGIDIGMYDTCPNNCLYCYANSSPGAAAKNHAAHNPESPLISGDLMPGDEIKERNVKSCRVYQPDLFD